MKLKTCIQKRSTKSFILNPKFVIPQIVTTTRMEQAQSTRRASTPPNKNLGNKRKETLTSCGVQRWLLASRSSFRSPLHDCACKALAGHCGHMEGKVSARPNQLAWQRWLLARLAELALLAPFLKLKLKFFKLTTYKGHPSFFWVSKKDTLVRILDVFKNILFEIWVSRDTFGGKIQPSRCQIYALSQIQPILPRL